MHRPLRRSIISVVAAFAFFSGYRPQCSAQTVTLPQGWQQMSPTDFASAVRSLFEQGKFNSLSDDDKNAAADYGLQLFSNVDMSNTSLNYQTLEMLHWVCRSIIDPSTADHAKTALLGRQDDWTGKAYAEVRAKVVMMMRLKVPEPFQISEGRKWVAAGGSLDQIPKPDLKFEIVRKIFGDLQIINGAFTVQWNGLINPPQPGNYVFSISPINVNSADPQYPTRFTMSVTIGGQPVLIATPSNWVTQSSPVALATGQPSTIQVNVSADVPMIRSGELHALLYWQGPGVSTSLVPAASFTQADTGSAGLKATYSWKSNGQPQTLTRVEPLIDAAWLNSSVLLAKDTLTSEQASNAMWQAMSATDYIKSLMGPPVQLHPFLKDPHDAASGLPSDRRQAFLTLLVANPVLLDAASPVQIVDFYQSFRIGAPDLALDVFGLWATRKADLAMAITGDRVLDGDVRNAFRYMSTYATLELPAHAVRLQNEFLQLPDGRCSLPVAYTLAFSYLGRGKLADFASSLNNRLLNDASLTGDLRANWLIARAMIQEIRLAAPNPYAPPEARPLDGRSFLDQASKAAASPAVQVRVLQEIAARLATTQQFQAAKDILQQASTSLPDDQKAVLAAWQQQIDAVSSGAALLQQKQASTARQAYLNGLQARRAQAAKNGDTDGVSRYDALINAATANK